MVHDVVELGRLADANMAASWARLASFGAGKVGRSDRCTLVATGIPAAFFNGGFVADATGLETVRDVAARGFEMPAEFVDRLFAESLLADPSMTVVLGSVDGTPLSCALASVTENIVGIYNVATPVAHRRRGCGTAVTWAAIRRRPAWAATRRSCRHRSSEHRSTARWASSMSAGRCNSKDRQRATDR